MQIFLFLCDTFIVKSILITLFDGKKNSPSEQKEQSKNFSYKKMLPKNKSNGKCHFSSNSKATFMKFFVLWFGQEPSWTRYQGWLVAWFQNKFQHNTLSKQQSIFLLAGLSLDFLQRLAKIQISCENGIRKYAIYTKLCPK